MKNYLAKLAAGFLVAAGLFTAGPGVNDTWAAIASGTSGSCSWEIDDAGVMTISPTDGTSGTLRSSGNSTSDLPWSGYVTEVKKVIINPGVKAHSYSNHLFNGMKNCTEIDLGNLDTSNATTMSGMFQGCEKLTSLNLSGWNTSNVTNMGYMFYGCKGLTSLDLSGFNTANVEYMTCMFDQCSWLTSLNVSSFNTSKVKGMKNMFGSCSNLTTLDVSGFDTSQVTTMESMFSNCAKLTSLNVSGFNTSQVTNMSSMFESCRALTSLNVSNFNTSSVTTMGNMFKDCNALTSLNVRGWDTSNVTNMYSMFRECHKLVSLDVSGFNTSSATTMAYMFNHCYDLTDLNVSGFDTSNVLRMSNMFQGCDDITTLDVSEWNTSKVTDMSCMFNDCTRLANLDVSGWDTSKVTRMDNMFYHNNLANLDVSGWETPQVINMNNMFNGCNKLISLNLSNFNTSSVTNMANMFYGCTNLSKVVFPETFFVGTAAYFSDTEVKKWVHKRDLTGAKLNDNTEYTGTQIMALSSTTTPTLGGTWQRTDYMPHTDLGDGDVEYISEDDEWEKNGDTWTYKFKVFDDTLRYFLYEEGIPGYTSDEMAPGYTIVNDGEVTKTATITNREDIDYGSLEIRKTVSGTDTDDRFTFDIVLSGPRISGTQIFSDIVFRDGAGVVSLADGETKLIEQIPAGTTYTVTERAARNFTTASTGSSGSITKDNTSTAAFTNTYQTPPPEEHPVDFKIRKSVTGHFEDAGEFTFHAYMTGLTPDHTYSMSNGSTFTADDSGSADVELSLADGDEVTFIGLKEGATVRVTEEGGENHTAEYRATLGGTAVASGETTEKNTFLTTSTLIPESSDTLDIHYTNRMDHRQDLVVAKRVENEAHQTENSDDEFEITLEFNRLTPGESYISDMGRVIADEDGYAIKSFFIKGKESVKFYGLPVGSTYTVKETASAGYIASYEITGDNVTAVTPSAENPSQNMDLSTAVETVNQGEQATVTFTNMKRRTGAVRLKKTDMGGNILPGAKFQVFEQLGAAPDKMSDRYLGEMTVAANGYLLVEGRAAGTYYFVESEAPEGYTLDTTPHAVTLTQEQITEQNADPGNMDLVPTITVTNKPNAGKIKIRKTVSENGHVINDGTTTYADATPAAKTLLAGEYTFGLYKDEACDTPYTVGGTPKTITVQVAADCAPAVSSDTLVAAGTYWIKEENLPNGIHAVPAKQRVVVTNDNYDNPVTVDFRNDVQTFKLPVSVTKVIPNGTTTATFSFTMKENGNTIKNLDITGAGTGTFSDIIFIAPVEGETHVYRITETNTGVNGIRYDTTVYDVYVSFAKAAGEAGERGEVAMTVETYKGGPATAPSSYIPGASGTPQTVTDIDFTNINKGTSAASITFTNDLTKPIEIRKIWDDANNQDGLRPQAVSVTILADGTAVKSVNVSAPTFVYREDGFPMYKADGTPITYTVTETEPTGYALTSNTKTGNTTDGYVFELTNKHEPAVTSVKVRKRWDDMGDIANLRPENLVVSLYADGGQTPTATTTLNAANEWTYTFGNLPKNNNGRPIVYTVQEEEVTGYISSEAIAVSDKTYVKVHKNWTGVAPENQNGTITVKLFADGVQTKTGTIKASDIVDDEHWTILFEDLPRYNGTNEIVYTAAEDGGTGADLTVTMQKDDFLFVNECEPFGEIRINKVINEQYEPFGVPTFIFEVTGTDNAGVAHRWVRALTMDSYALEKGTVIKDVPLGTYTIREINVSRYRFEELTIDVGEGTVADIKANVTLSGEHQEAEVTYKNKIEQYEKFSHETSVVNHVGSTTEPAPTEPAEPMPDESNPSGE